MHEAELATWQSMTDRVLPIRVPSVDFPPPPMGHYWSQGAKWMHKTEGIDLTEQCVLRYNPSTEDHYEMVTGELDGSSRDGIH